MPQIHESSPWITSVRTEAWSSCLLNLSFSILKDGRWGLFAKIWLLLSSQQQAIIFTMTHWTHNCVVYIHVRYWFRIKARSYDSNLLYKCKYMFIFSLTDSWKLFAIWHLIYLNYCTRPVPIVFDINQETIVFHRKRSLCKS